MVQTTRARAGNPPQPSARERILNAATELFCARGVGAVGINLILQRSGCAKASLYKNFGSKSGLILAFLERREHLFLHQWLEKEILKRAPDPEGRLLAIFDLFEEWFREDSFAGCPYVRVLLDTAKKSVEHDCARQHLSNVRAVIADLARDAGLADADRFAQVWHMLMKGVAIAALEGGPDAACQARQAAGILLANWPRQAS